MPLGDSRQPRDKAEGGRRISKRWLIAIALVALLIPYVGWLIAIGLLAQMLRDEAK
jgi:hypothetical protein